MISHLIDEISPEDMKKVKAFLKKNAVSSELESIFWIRIPEDILSENQFQHADCRPHVFAVELGNDWIKMEFFVRSLRGMRCDCQAYCTPQQMDFILNYAQKTVADLQIRT